MARPATDRICAIVRSFGRSVKGSVVVFDGAGLEGARAPGTAAPRGVRLLFSGAGEIADDLLRALVRAEPPGRPLVVVTSDREVAEDVRRDGARPVPSRALLALLARAR